MNHFILKSKAIGVVLFSFIQQLMGWWFASKGWLVTKTLAVASALFILSWILFIILFNSPFIHGFYETIESFVYFQIFTSTANPNEHLVIIDEQDREYDRATYAQLIRELDRLGAKVIALDVLFNAERDPTGSAQLVAATESAGDKVIHAMEFLNYENQAIIPERFHLKLAEPPSPDNYVEGARGVSLPFKNLLAVTRHLGHVVQTSDVTMKDLRYFPLVLNYNDHLYPSVSLLAVMKFWGCRTDTLPQEPYEIVNFVCDQTNGIGYPIPINSKAQTLINFVAKEKFAGKVFSVETAKRLFQENSSVFNNKIVLIGNSFDSQDQWFGPHFQTYPSLIVHATLISQMLNNENIREGVLETLGLSFILMILGVVFLLLTEQRLARLRFWHFSLLSLIVFFLVTMVFFSTGIKTLVVLPYFVFLISVFFSKKYYSTIGPTPPDSIDKPIKILFLAGNPVDTDKLRLDEEMRGIDQSLRQAEFRDRFETQQQWAVRVTDLQGHLLRHRPHIVHFSGHGSPTSEIILEDNNGNSQPVSVRALGQLFSVLKDNIRCVVLNACYSEQQAQAIAKHVDCVIGMSKAIGDKAAISFAVAFYQALGFGRDVKTAFDLGCLQIDLQNLDEQDTPKLLALRKNPQEIVFAQSDVNVSEKPQ